MPEHYSPLAGFVIAAVTAIAMPRLMERLKLAAVLGYIAAGILIGPAMLGVVQKSPSTDHSAPPDPSALASSVVPSGASAGAGAVGPVQ